MESLLRSTLQAAELGLEPGSAVGESYLVPYGDQCTLIVGYRGLIALAFRSGHVKSVKANIVYQSDTFKYVDGINVTLHHEPNFSGERDVKDITFAYCVVQLRDGGILYDVMTRGEVDRIRNQSKASRSGPWVDHYAEMARKTVTRRCLKYAPMSIEMSKALAVDEAADTGTSAYGGEFEVLEAEYEVQTEEPTGPSKSDRTRDRIPEVEGEPYTGSTVKDEPQEPLI